MKLIVDAIWFLLPSGFANMAPVVASRLFPRWTFPVDAGKRFRGRRIFGAHKTVRGLISGVLLAMLICRVQKAAYVRWAWAREASLFDYGEVSPAFGALLGAGALAGDLVKSFFKRQWDIGPGRSWFPFDQVDWVLGTLLVASPFLRFAPSFLIATVLYALFASLLVRWFGYCIGLNETAL